MHSYILCHIIFDVNMVLTRKSRYVATGFHSPKSDEIRYKVVVSREILCIAFIYATINGIDILASDIQNAYITAPCYENCWTICVPEFGSEHESKKDIIVQDLYGLPCMGNNF